MIQYTAAAFLFLAIIHTLCAPLIAAFGTKHKKYHTACHLLSETELIFVLWGVLFLLARVALSNLTETLDFLSSQRFIEPVFVFVIMLVASCKPILTLVEHGIDLISSLFPSKKSSLYFFLLFFLLPLTGSLITEPAAMTLAAFILRDKFLPAGFSEKKLYLILAVLFLNISLGGTLTAFAAPPVLMVAHTFGWDSMFMLKTFGSHSVLILFVTSLCISLLCKKELSHIEISDAPSKTISATSKATGVFFLALTILFSHYYLPLLVILAGFTLWYLAAPQAHEKVNLKAPTLVSLFLAALVVLGAEQKFWVAPLLQSLSEPQLFWGSILLTGFLDNAALTFLGSQIPNLTPGFQYALVAGALTGGGLTIIANAPNPAGAGALKQFFHDSQIVFWKLFLAALLPTVFAAIIFLI